MINEIQPKRKYKNIVQCSFKVQVILLLFCKRHVLDGITNKTLGLSLCIS